MRLTTARLRALIVNPTSFIAAARLPVVSTRGFGNAQRAWIQAAIRSYFEHDRDEAALWAAFDKSVDSKPATQRRVALAQSGHVLLERFVAWHSTDPDLPADVFPPSADVKLGAHTIAVRRDLIYVAGGGYRCRQLWTDHELRPHHPRAISMAAAVLLSVDADLGAGSTSEVEVWGLRHGTRRSWSREELTQEATQLLASIDAAALAIQKP